MTSTAYVIDPATRTVNPIQIDSVNDLAVALRCNRNDIDVQFEFANGDKIYVNRNANYGDKFFYKHRLNAPESALRPAKAPGVGIWAGSINPRDTLDPPARTLNGARCMVAFPGA